jgi:hypothetical protein
VAACTIPNSKDQYLVSVICEGINQVWRMKKVKKDAVLSQFNTAVTGMQIVNQGKGLFV